MTLAPERDVEQKTADPVPSNPAVAKRAAKLLEEAETWGEQIAAVWIRLLKREQKVVSAKLSGSKAREGTRFWDPAPPPHETKAFKVGKFIDTARWLGELEDELTPIFNRLYSSYLDRGAALFEEKGKRGRMKDRKRLAELTAARISEARDYHEAWLERLTEMADRIAASPNATVEGLVDQIEVHYSQAEEEVGTVAHSQAVGATNEAQLEVVRSLGMKGKKVWWTAQDGRVRDAHKLAHGQRRELDKPFKVAGQNMDYPGDRSVDPSLWIQCRCLPGENVVAPGGTLLAAMRRPYDGPIVELVTALGHRFTATPNHPVLTLRGWRPIHRLEPGDYVVRSSLDQAAALPDPYVGHAPVSIEELFDTVALSGSRSQRMTRVGVDFYGDAADSQVDIAIPNDDLSLHWDAPSDQQLLQLVLASAHGEMSPLGPSGPTSRIRHPQLVGLAAPPEGDPSLLQAKDNRAPLGVESGRQRIHRLSGQIAGHDLAFASGDYGSTPFPGRSFGLSVLDRPHQATLLQNPGEPGGSDASGLSGHHDVRTSQVELDRVLKVRVSNWAGHVYDLQTATGWFTADTIVAHNCVLLFYPMTVTGEPEAGLEAASRWAGLQRDLARDVLGWADRLETKKKLKHVRTPEGRRKYGEQIGEIIHPDLPDLGLSRMGSRENPWRTSSAKEAALHLSTGDYVELDRPKRAAVLINQLRKIAKDAEKRGEQAPLYDLCKVTVRDTSLFCVRSKGVARIHMPQLTGIPTPGSRADGLLRDSKGKVDLAPYFLEHLAKHGADVHHDVELASRLIASQNELDGAKVGRMMRRIKRGESVRELFVSNDNYIVDGHHHWAATVGLDASNDIENELSMRVARVDMGITELLALAKAFAEEWGVGARGVDTKSFLRRVRTPEGHRKYGEEIGEPIVPDLIPRVRIANPLPPIRDFSGWGERGDDIEALARSIDRAALVPHGLPSFGGRWDPDAAMVPESTRAALRQIYEYDDAATGLSTRIDHGFQRVGTHRWRVAGTVRDLDGNEAGTWEKIVDFGQEPPGAFHGLISIYDRHQGQGFGERLLRHEENAYIAIGVGHVDLLAGLNVGGYAWARAGFDWHHSPGAMRDPWFRVRARMEELLDGDSTPDEKLALTQMLARFDGDDIPTPAEIAMMGWAPQSETERRAPSRRHLGKRILQGTEWEARKTLVPPLVLAEKVALTSAELLRARLLAGEAEAWFRECQARNWDLGDDGLDWNPAPADEEKSVATLVRHVRTPEGHRQYGEDIGEIIHPDLPQTPWERLQERAVLNPADSPSPRYWLRPDGMWVPVAWHEDAFPRRSREVGQPGLYREFTEDTHAVRVTIAAYEASINVFHPMTRQQVDALSTIRRPSVIIAPEAFHTNGRIQRVEDSNPENMRAGLEWANRMLRGTSDHPSRLAEFKGITKHVATEKGVRYYDLPLHSPIVPRINVPKPRTRASHLSDASKVAAHQSDPDRSQRLLELYAEGLPDRGMTFRGGAGLGTEVLFIEENRQAAKAELVDNLFARLDPDTRRQLAEIGGIEQTKLMQSMQHNKLMVGKYGELPGPVPTDPFDPRMVWRKFNWDHSAGVWEADPYENFANLFPDHVGPWTEGQGRNSLAVVMNPESGSVHRSAEGYKVDYLRGDDPRLIDALAKDQLSVFIHKWADTSNDNDAMSLAIQDAIAAEFDLPDTMEWKPRGPRRGFEDAWEHIRKTTEIHQARLPLYRKLVRAQYDVTQDWFRDAGITELLIHRGMQWGDNDTVPAWFDAAKAQMGNEDTPTMAMPQLRPASSWAYGHQTASNFAGIRVSAKDVAIMQALGSNVETNNQPAAILTTVVPVAAILGTPRTGFGALPEEEVVLLSVKGSVQVMVKGEFPQTKSAFLDDIARLETKRAVPHVRTPEGVRKYGQPLNTPIVLHPHTPTGQMMRRLAKDRGFTIHPSGVEPHTGYAVAKGGHSSITPAAEFFSSEAKAQSIIKAWLKKNAAVFDDPEWHIGGWYDTEHDEIVLDPSQVVHDLVTAGKLAVDRDEQSIFDLKNKVEIPTGGSGGRKSLPSFACSPLPRAFHTAGSASEATANLDVVGVTVKALAASLGDGEGVASSALLRLGDRFQVAEPLAVPNTTEVVYLKALGDGAMRLFVDPPMNPDALAAYNSETGVAVVLQPGGPEEAGAEFGSVKRDRTFDGVGGEPLDSRRMDDPTPCVVCHDEVRLLDGGTGGREEKSDPQAAGHGAAHQEDLRDDRRGAGRLLWGDRGQDVRAGGEEAGVLGALAQVVERKSVRRVRTPARPPALVFHNDPRPITVANRRKIAARIGWTFDEVNRFIDQEATRL